MTNMRQSKKRSLRTLSLALIVTITLIPFSHAKESTTMPKPKVIIFDVNETLLDLAPLRKSVGKALQGREDLLSLWFSTMLHYSLVNTVTNNYQDFAQIGSAALNMVATNQGISLSNEAAKKAIIGSITKLPAHPDVIPSLTSLRNSGYHIVSLTNSSNAGVAAQFSYAGLTEFFERRFSVEDVRTFKPAPRPYQWVLEELNVKPEETLMVAAHAWDLIGAKAIGLQTAFIQRPGTTLYPETSRPDYVVDSLTELASILAKK
jgi:2-haloacid dehalogenase